MAFTNELQKDSLKITVTSEGKLVKEYLREYLCKNDTELTLDEVGANVGIVPGAPHPDWEAARAKEISIDRNLTREPYCSWLAKYSYSTEGVVPADSGSTAPEDRRVVRTIGTSQQQRFIMKNRDGSLIVDTAGSPFDGGIPVTDYMGTFTWERDEPHTGFNLEQAHALSGKTNLTEFMGKDPGTLMLEVTSREKWEGGFHFWTTTYSMVYDKDGWNPRPLNAGLCQIVGGRRERIQEEDANKNKMPTQEPQPLDALGAVIPVESRPDACIFIETDHYEPIEFADLELPTT